jgi:hypothetical protein
MTQLIIELPPEGLKTWFEVFNKDGDWEWFRTIEEAKVEAWKWAANGKSVSIQTPAYDWDKKKPTYVGIGMTLTHQEEVDRGTEFVENEDGIFYDFEDHCHIFYVTTEMVSKHKLEDVADEMDEGEIEDLNESGYEGHSYTHSILIDDVIGYRKSKDDLESTTMTPWGQCGSSTFEAYFNGFPVELFDEPDENALYSQL